MNAPFSTSQRSLERRRIRAAHVERMAAAALRWAEKPHSKWAELAFRDAERWTSDSHVSDAAGLEYADLCHDLRISEEGYPINDDGDVIAGAEREYVPLATPSKLERAA